MATEAETEAAVTVAATAVGKDAERLQQMILNFDAVQMREIFWDVDAEQGIGTVCYEALDLLRSMTDEEKAKCCRDLVQNLLDKENPRYVHIERILTKLFIAAYEREVISLPECCELLVTCTDFTLRHPIDAKKFEFVQSKLHLIDYKGLRSILKLLVVDRMQEMPSQISHYHRQMLLPVENRVAKKFNELFISFRPLAEMVVVIGRPWLFPISTHISFVLIANSWKLEPVSTRIHQRAHLPYRSELFAPQSALLYTLLRQPRGKEAMAWVIRPTSNAPRLQCDELLQMIILEAMSEMEKTDVRVDDAVNQYQWMNITQTVTFSLIQGHASFSRLLKILYESLTETVYRKGRAELMWIILQYVAIFLSQITTEDMQRIADIYNLLYKGEEAFWGVDTDPLFFVRIFVPAAIWINFYTKDVATTPKPSESLQSQIQFLKQTAEADQNPALKNVADHNAVLAAVANAYSNDMETFKKLVLDNVESFLDCKADEREQLPYMVMCHGRRVPLSLILIDSLTIHSRYRLLQMLLLKIHSVIDMTPPLKYPSPAVVDTLARLAATTDYEYAAKQLVLVMTRTLEQLNQMNPNDPAGETNRAKDLLYIFCEIFSYCLVNSPYPLTHKATFLHTSYVALSNSVVHMSGALYAAFEQVLLRFWMWNCPHEMFILSNQLIGKQGKLAYLITSPDTFNDFQPGNFNDRSVNISPELMRCLLLSFFRALKITGLELQTEVLQRINKNFVWPRSTSQTFAAQIPNCTIDDGTDFAQMDELCRYVAQFLYANSEEQIVKYFNEDRNMNNLFCVIYLLICETKKCYPVFFSILKNSNAKQIVIMTNKLADYVIHTTKRIPPSDDATFTTMISALNEMLFNYHLVSFEKFLLSFVLHPTDDDSTQAAFVIIHSMVTFDKDRQAQRKYVKVASFCDLNNRLAFLFHIVPSNKLISNNSVFFAKLAEYYSQFPELTYSEMEMKLRYEMRLDMNMRRLEQQSFIHYGEHMPIYYGNLAERILPVVDVLLFRALEIGIADEIFDNLLSKFKTCYKYHPQPANFLYSVLYCLYKKLGHTPRAQKFVSEICSQVEERDGSNQLVSRVDQILSPPQLCMSLVDRILQGTNYPHQPPSFACKDWRFAELPPAGQALTGACIELMASQYHPNITVRELIEIAFVRPLRQPYAAINAISLILTSLPPSFQQRFFDHIVSVVASKELRDGDPSICFENLEGECFLLTESYLMTNLALCHAYLQHCTNYSLSVLPDFVKDHLVPILETETQLLFVLRLVLPILQRLYDAKERNKQLQDLAVDVYKMTVKVNEMVGRFKYEDTVCDFLYHMKYMYVGDFIKSEAEQAIQKLTSSMREKLVYISHSQASAADAAKTLRHPHGRVAIGRN
ncbi:unnamed protein product [Enterobius vermicularis]|uniref:Mediator of RNA polymerase II transcription subunit 23 n=1 Tax=Enterobius vermicularis TaxID=51028 RepID=A0A0N4V8Y0_ENTVE|nr:unnamed protein product [Enterobius vermicularis]